MDVKEDGVFACLSLSIMKGWDILCEGEGRLNVCGEDIVCEGGWIKCVGQLTGAFNGVVMGLSWAWDGAGKILCEEG